MMRYKALVLRDLEKIDQALNAIKNGMDNRSIDEKEVYDRIKYALEGVASMTEKIGLEPDATT